MRQNRPKSSRRADLPLVGNLPHAFGAGRALRLVRTPAVDLGAVPRRLFDVLRGERHLACFNGARGGLPHPRRVPGFVKHERVRDRLGWQELGVAASVEPEQAPEFVSRRLAGQCVEPVVE